MGLFGKIFEKKECAVCPKRHSAVYLKGGCSVCPHR